MDFNPIDSKIRISLDKSQYSQAVILKCFYWYTGKFQVQIDEKNSKEWEVTILLPHDQQSDENIDTLKSKILQDLIDFKLRQVVTEETKFVRELLIAKAFALHETDDNPNSDASDPVGFNPIHLT